MKEQIVSSENFTIQVDVSKNRIYATFNGFWSNVGIIKSYRSNLGIALEKVKRNFTLVADLRNFKTLPPELVAEQKGAMGDLAKAGMYKVAEILPQSAIASMQLSQSANDTKMPNRQFATMEQGEQWLDNEIKKL